jgi:hypothetical protein
MLLPKKIVFVSHSYPPPLWSDIDLQNKNNSYMNVLFGSESEVINRLLSNFNPNLS